MKVIKRDGRTIDFDRAKIQTAIEKANKEVRGKEKATKEEIDEIISYIEDLGKKRMLVEDIQDVIEEKLMELDKYELAKKYIVYRYTRALVRKSNTTDINCEERKAALLEQMQSTFAKEEEVADCLTVLRSICKQMVQDGFGQPTAFEIETVMAFMLFEKWNVDIAIVECGLGGRMDATNFLINPFLCLFTSIGIDHMGILGNTKEEIAKEKFGIIKKNTTVVSLKQDFSLKLLEQICKEQDAKLYLCDTKQIINKVFCLNHNTFSYLGEKYVLEQNGVYQTENAALAIHAAKILEKKGMHRITIPSIQKALEESFWYGRFELLLKKPCMIVDGAHNEDGALRLKESLEMYFPEEKCIFIVGMFRDKTYDKVLEIMLPYAKRLYTVSTKGKRKLDAKELASHAAALNQDLSIQSCDSIQQAVREAKKEADKNRRREKSSCAVGLVQLFDLQDVLIKTGR